MAYKEGGRPATGGLRPKPGSGSHEITALNRPFPACGKLRLTVMGTQPNARSAIKMPST